MDPIYGIGVFLLAATRSRVYPKGTPISRPRVHLIAVLDRFAVK
jgi:hypothetical protein